MTKKPFVAEDGTTKGKRLWGIVMDLDYRAWRTHREPFSLFRWDCRLLTHVFHNPEEGGFVFCGRPHDTVSGEAKKALLVSASMPSKFRKIQKSRSRRRCNTPEEGRQGFARESWRPVCWCADRAMPKPCRWFQCLPWPLIPLLLVSFLTAPWYGRIRARFARPEFRETSRLHE